MVKFRNNFQKRLGIIIIASSVLLITALMARPIQGFASSDYGAYEGVVKSNIHGVQGVITILQTPKISTPAGNYRDYMVYANLANQQTMGSGAYAYLSGSTVAISAAEYWYTVASGSNTIVNNSPISTNTAFIAKVEHTSSSGNCWKASTANGNNNTHCFSSTTTPVNNLGAMSQAMSGVSYSSGVNDLPSLYDDLRGGYWSGSAVNFGDPLSPFSSSSTASAKCGDLSGYIKQNLASYTGSVDNIDKIGVGPGTYNTDNCSHETGYQMW